MPRSALPLLFLLLVALAPARDKPEGWIEVRSEHFLVATNFNEKQARRVADQFERMRSVFHRAFPKMRIDTGSPVIVLAVKNEKDFRELEPESYLAKGQVKLGGLFLRTPDKNYVLMRLDAEGEHPYAVVYHEYTHLLMSRADWMPLWLNEGLAEFYQNTEIREKEVLIGEPSADNIMLLRQEKLLPLPTLFLVDHSSPYYHEEHKGNIFYAESWALTHYLQMKDYEQKTDHLTEYAGLLVQKVDPIEAASRAFGDLKQLQSELEKYIHRAAFYAFKSAAATEVDDSKFQAQALAPAHADALRADFLAYNDRTADARSLLDRVMQEDPNNVSARETLGFIEFRQHHIEEARKWYAQAVQLDSQSYLAHYYFAAITMDGSMSASDDPQVENSLRTAIKLNPSFAPSYDMLAVFLGMRRRNLEEAHNMGLMAVSLDPASVQYRVHVASVLLAMGQGTHAIQVLQAAAKLAKSPQEKEWVDNTLTQAQMYAAAQESMAEPKPEVHEEVTEQVRTDQPSDNAHIPHLAHRAEFVARGPHRFVTGTLKNVRCDTPYLELTVTSGAKTLALRSDNYYKIQFSALGFLPSGDLKPCVDLEGRAAKVEYVESANPSDMARLLGVELHK